MTSCSRVSADCLKGDPFGSIDQRPWRADLLSGQGLDRGNALASLGMVQQQLGTRVRRARDPEQDAPERPPVTADLVHESHAVMIGCGLDLARVAGLQD